jgi:hypothetical protein
VRVSRVLDGQVKATQPAVSAGAPQKSWSPHGSLPTRAPTSLTAVAPDGHSLTRSARPAAARTRAGRLQNHYIAHAMAGNTRLPRSNSKCATFGGVYCRRFHWVNSPVLKSRSVETSTEMAQCISSKLTRLRFAFVQSGALRNLSKLRRQLLDYMRGHAKQNQYRKKPVFPN